MQGSRAQLCMHVYSQVRKELHAAHTRPFSSPDVNHLHPVGQSTDKRRTQQYLDSTIGATINRPQATSSPKIYPLRRARKGPVEAHAEGRTRATGVTATAGSHTGHQGAATGYQSVVVHRSVQTTSLSALVASQKPFTNHGGINNRSGSRRLEIKSSSNRTDTVT